MAVWERSAFKHRFGVWVLMDVIQRAFTHWITLMAEVFNTLVAFCGLCMLFKAFRHWCLAFFRLFDIILIRENSFLWISCVAGQQRGINLPIYQQTIFNHLKHYKIKVRSLFIFFYISSWISMFHFYINNICYTESQWNIFFSTSYLKH